MAHRKPHLPTKVCPACERPFAWRRKWALAWSDVVWCSDRCRRLKRRSGTADGGRPSPSAPSAAVTGSAH